MSTPVAVSDPLRVAWFVATGIEAEAYVEQVRATLYGAVDLIWTMGADGAKCKRCYFFTWSEFMGLPNLDAAVVGTASQGQLCINSHGRQTDRVCACALRQLFGEAALDPLAEEAAGAAFIADAASDVRDEAAMLESVKAKYGLSFLLPFKPTQHTGVAWLPGGRT